MQIYICNNKNERRSFHEFEMEYSGNTVGIWVAGGWGGNDANTVPMLGVLKKVKKKS